jgi:hypothetical protein
MCTVTYLPLSGGFVLASNRDEALGRAPAVFPARQLEPRPALYAKDTEAGGTWLIASHGRAVCLLNGAFLPHRRTPPYRLSRGMLVLHTLSFDAFDDFVSAYDFESIEPFTLVWAQAVADTTDLRELRWDGQQLHTKYADAGLPHLWASATLYTPSDYAHKRKWLDDWLLATPYDQWVEQLGAFQYLNRMQNPDYDVASRYGNVSATLSISQVRHQLGGTHFHYFDLTKQKLKQASLGA